MNVLVILVVVIFIGTVVFATWQGRLIRNLANIYSRPTAEWPPDRPLPKAAVILSLRGHDPFLQRCIENLIRQDYPDFMIQIVVDSDGDPAWEAVNEVRRKFDDVRLNARTLSDRRPSCSLKNSSIIEAIRGLPADVEVVALVDADAIVPSTWLRNLVAPLADPEVGCTTGVRWFAPVERSFGSRLRCYWNLVAAPMIFASSTAWGGSMLIRRSILDSGLTDEWSLMFCEDAHTINHLRQRAIKLQYVPEATIVNQERISVMSCIRFVNRQKLIFRLYHVDWLRLMVTILSAAILRIGHDVLIALCLVWRDFTTAAILAGIHPMILLVLRFEAARLDRAVHAMLQKSGQEIPKTLLPGPVGYLGVEFLFVTSMFTAVWTRSATWRGIEYRISGPTDITMLAYRPYEVAAIGSQPSPETVV